VNTTLAKNTVRIEKTDKFIEYRVYINGMDITSSVVNFIASAGVAEAPRIIITLTNIQLDVAESQEKAESK
jgi:hypothetical protein